jgi:hypothetical protein
MASLNPIVSSQPPNFGMGDTFSFVTVENDQNRTLFAKAVYVVNESFTDGEVKVSYADSPSVDAFGRVRMSTPTTLFDSKTLHNKQSLFWSSTAIGTGAVNFTGNNDASVTLSAAAAGDYAIRQTNQRFAYQPGRSQMAMFTGILNPVSNAVKRLGLFTSLTAAPYTPNVGLYFETQTDSPSSIAVVQNNSSGLVPSVSALRHEWNLDRLDGTGPSKKVLTLSAANIFTMDYEWLGVGRVRFGVVIDGQIIYCHEINNAGNVQGAYLKTPNLPARAEIRQTEAGTASMKMVCFFVASEGGADYTGVSKGVDTGSSLTIGANARRAVLGLRLQATKLDSVNEIINAGAIALTQSNATNAAFRYEIIHNPYGTNYFGVSGGTWNNVDVDSNFQYWRCDAGGNIPYNGTVVSSGYGSTGSTIDLTGTRFQKFLKLGCTVTGQRDEIYLVITPLEANNGVFGSFVFLESD